MINKQDLGEGGGNLKISNLKALHFSIIKLIKNSLLKYGISHFANTLGITLECLQVV